MNVPISVRIRSFFTRNKHNFWFDHFTNDEKQLRRMDAWQLATVIHEENICQTAPERRTVAEHMLNVRLVKIQNRATYFSIFFGILGVIIGVFLTTALQKPESHNKLSCECIHNTAIRQSKSGGTPINVPFILKRSAQNYSH